MKKLHSTIMMLAMIVAALSLTACGDDDDEIGGNSGASIIGVWKCTSTNYGEWEKMLKDNTKVGDVLTFNSDNTYTISGNNNESGKYSVNGNTLNFNSNGFTTKWYINELSSAKLSITMEVMGVSLSFKKK